MLYLKFKGVGLLASSNQGENLTVTGTTKIYAHFSIMNTFHVNLKHANISFKYNKHTAEHS